MTDTYVVHLAMHVLLIAGELSAPMLVTSLVVGFTVSLFQSATQIQEFTLSFVPKAVCCSLALLVCGHWMLTTMISFTTDLFQGIPQMLAAG